MHFGRQKKHADGYGMDVVWPPEGQGDQDANVDIVFIHGLGGRRHSTWTKGETFWPLDLLSKDYPRARIMTWGYDSRIMSFLGPVGQGSVHSHANELNNDLSAERSERHQVFRPLIFFAHSLGGLIVKHALFTSWIEYASESNNKDRSAALERSTIAVMFAGTPHRGSDKARWARVAARLASVIQKDHNSRLAEALEKGSDVLETLQEYFKKIENNFHVFSFFEEVPVAKVGHVVESDSAAIHCAHEKRRMLHGNHMDMVRFDDSSSNEYKKVKDAFKQIHAHEIDGVMLRDVTQPPNRLRNRTSFDGGLREPQAIGSNQPRLLEHQASQMSLGSNNTLTVDEIVDRPSPQQRQSNYSNHSQSSTESRDSLGRLPYRASTTTLATTSSHNSRTSDRSSEFGNIPSPLPRTQYLYLLQSGRSLATHRGRDFLSDLKSAQTYFQRALDLLQSPPLNSDLSQNYDLATVYYQMMDASFNLSFHTPLTTEQKLSHLNSAEQYSLKAIRHAELASTVTSPRPSGQRSSSFGSATTSNSSSSVGIGTNEAQILQAQTALYIAIIKGRRAELLCRLPTTLPSSPLTSQQKRNAIVEIDAAVSTLRSLNSASIAESEDFAQVWRVRLGWVPPATTTTASVSQQQQPPPPSPQRPPQQQQQQPQPLSPHSYYPSLGHSYRNTGAAVGTAATTTTQSLFNVSTNGINPQPRANLFRVPENMGTHVMESLPALPAYSELSIAVPRGPLPAYTPVDPRAR